MDNSDQTPNERQNISFKFTKLSSKSLTGNKLNETNHRDYVLSVDKSEIKSTLAKPKPKDLVIPLIKRNNWRQSDSSHSDLTDEERKLKDLAVQELINESNAENDKWEHRDGSITVESIPLIMQNKVPDGFETDDRMDVSLRPEESTLENYEDVPIEQFGLAMLRGMGWKEGDGIGGKRKMCAKPIEVQLRPKGLGLGADTSALKKAQGKMKEEKLVLIKGSFVTIIQGSQKGFYGEVLGLDEENARAIVKLSTDEKAQSFPEFFIRVVTKKEFDKESKVINRAAYENYKRDKEIKEEKETEHRERHKKSSRNEDDRKRSKDVMSTSEKESFQASRHSKKRHHSRDRSVEEKSKKDSKKAKLWVRPQLRVRFIDDKYKKGKYFNQKVVVFDVLSSDCCSCKTEDGKYLDDISPSMLETVIPRQESAYVMIVQGKYSGELCTILKRDKSNCIATVQFLSDRNQALKIEYDSICEYVGDVDQFD